MIMLDEGPREGTGRAIVSCCLRPSMLVTFVALGAFAYYMRAEITYAITGVFQTYSMDLDAEAQVFAERLNLRPGMTLCEMGSANGDVMAALAPYVMPGGRFVATSIAEAELRATRKRVRAAVGAVVTTYLANDAEWAPGLPDGTCDALYSRMVIHMIPKATSDLYIPQWARALKPGSLMFMTDHNPMDGTTSGPRKAMTPLMPMSVIPQETEVAEIAGGGFDLVDGPFAHPFYMAGYGAVYTPSA